MAILYKDATASEVEDALNRSLAAFHAFRKFNAKQRNQFLHAIAAIMEKKAEALLAAAAEETHLEKTRLKAELDRTLFQLRSYGEACEEGNWLDIRIHVAGRNNPDLRKMMVPLGPVVVFGASNFPFAYSTAGGDTACALAAGCSVIVKAHPAHAHTSELVAQCVQTAASLSGLPPDVFLHLHGKGFETGRALVTHPFTAAVGFTGSLEGGRALFDLAAQRPVPIPVFAEMGSVNPIFLLPQKLKEDTEGIALLLADSATQSAGQYCTNPGIMIGIQSRELEKFRSSFSGAIQKTRPVPMLHPGIAKAFRAKRSEALEEQGLAVAAISEDDPGATLSIPTLAEVSAADFLDNRRLHQEVFGPFTILVICRDLQEMVAVAGSFEGQLTTTVWATESEALSENKLLDLLESRCGRMIMNGVPTGVAVSTAMHHGGPYPATTDSRFTAVGADGIKRFARPVCYQNWLNALLPDELRNENPLGLWRMVNNELTKKTIGS